MTTKPKRRKRKTGPADEQATIQRMARLEAAEQHADAITAAVDRAVDEAESRMAGPARKPGGGCG